jgi:hypothetical protein
MSKTPYLLTVAQDRPTRSQRVTKFKAQHFIHTHNAGPGWKKEDHPWSACHMPTAYKCGYIKQGCNMFDAVARAGQLLEECGVLTTGETEAHAIRRLCENLELHCDL